MKNAVLFLGFAVFATAGCSQQIAVGAATAMITATRPSVPPPANTKDQIPEHEVWCYRTLGESQCYAEAQDVSPGRLISVEPQNLVPLTSVAYQDELARKRSRGEPIDSPPISDQKDDEGDWGKIFDF